MKLSRILFALIFAFLLTSCGNNHPAQPKLPKLSKVETASETMKNIRMVKWELSSFTLKDLNKAAISDGKKVPYLILRDGRASGFAGCNNFVGKYEEGVNNTIRFIDVQSPSRSCKNYAAQESSFINLLKTATSYEISETGKQMTIKSLMGELKFTTK